MPRYLAASCIIVLALASQCPGQGLDELRDMLSEDLGDVHFAKSFTGLVLLSDELELSSARYRFDDDVDTQLITFVLPFHTTLSVWGDDDPGLYLEGVVGYARASQRTDDIYGGSIPALATSIDTDWITYSGLVGAGLEFELADDLTAAPILNFGMARIENDTDFSGPGADFTAALTDGIAFNWDALVVSSGTAGRLDWTRPLGERHEFTLVSRYDLRWTDTVHEDDSAQDFSTRSQLLTMRGDVFGPTGLRIFGGDLCWRVTAGYRRFLEGDLFDIKEFVQIGGALELDTGDSLPIGSTFSLSTAVIVGEDFTGWTLGLGLAF